MRIAIVDSESTGLDLSDEPIVVGVLIVALDRHGRGIVIDEWRGEQEPSVQISPDAFAVHGRTRESLAGKSFDLDDLAKALDGCTVAIAHHAMFDAGMVGKAWPGIAVMDELEWRCACAQWPFSADIHGRSLDALCRHFGVQRAHPHDAIGGARVLLEVLNRKDPSSGQTHLSQLLAMPAFAEARLAAKAAAELAASRAAALSPQRAPAATPLEVDEQVIGVGVDRVKYLIKRPRYVGMPLPIVQFRWFHAATLDVVPLGTYFPISMQLNDIVATHLGRSVLEARADDTANVWLADSLKYCDEYDHFAKFVGKAEELVDFEILKRKHRDVPERPVQTAPPPLPSNKPQLSISWADGGALSRARVGSELALALKGDETISGYLDGKVMILADAKAQANRWIVDALRSGERLSAVISGKPDGFVDFTIRKHAA